MTPSLQQSTVIQAAITHLTSSTSLTTTNTLLHRLTGYQSLVLEHEHEQNMCLKFNTRSATSAGIVC